jgi:hypothetical protein
MVKLLEATMSATFYLGSVCAASIQAVDMADVVRLSLHPTYSLERKMSLPLAIDVSRPTLFHLSHLTSYRGSAETLRKSYNSCQVRSELSTGAFVRLEQRRPAATAASPYLYVREMRLHRSCTLNTERQLVRIMPNQLDIVVIRKGSWYSETTSFVCARTDEAATTLS